ncbi:YhgE/Pip domain-containing protein [Corynebacterium mayonis]|uniref:YhgE/Pip domain-containing protein n=1 Tax=Corynebacterium mayonis TaxID=3062461 RepID=UPI0031405461
MVKSGEILARDIRRLMRVPRAIIIIIGVLVTPALYAWFNINAFWDPYEQTRNIHIAVVNQDRGASTEQIGDVDVGGQIVEELKENDAIGWEFVDESRAHEGLKRGEFYAVFLIPPSFSEDFLSLTSGTYTQPVLEYYVNEKTNGVSPAITDTGATAVETSVTEAFKKKVGEAAAAELRDAGVSLRANAQEVRDETGGGLGQVAADLDAASERVSAMRGSVESARPVVTELNNVVTSVDTALGEIGTALGDSEALVRELEATSADFAAANSTAFIESANAVSTGAAAAQASIAGATDQLYTVKRRAQVLANEIDGVVTQGEAASAQLRALSTVAPLSPQIKGNIDAAIGVLDQRTDASRAVLDSLNQLDANSTAALGSLEALGQSLQKATAESSETARAASRQLASTVPAVNASLARLSGNLATVQGAVRSQQALTDETTELLAGVDRQLGASTSVLDEVAGNLNTLANGARDAQSDVALLLSTSDSDALNTVTGLNSLKIGEYIASPINVEQQPLFPTDNYGSSMAAFFTNLALWIGVFVLTIIFRVEVDLEGFRRLTVGQAYMGRFMLFATLAVAQAVVVSVGNMAFGVQMISAPAFLLTAVATSVAYTGIIYALVSALGHIGRGLTVFLVLIQIPGASGLYPIELMPGFFQRIYPFLPFRYGIDAMRETIAGFSGGSYMKCMGALAVMSLVALTLGWLFRRTSSHANHLFNRELERTNLISNENVEVMGSPYRISDIVAALADREEFNAGVTRRSHFLREHYHTLIAAGLGAGVVGICIITLMAQILPTDKSVMLAVAVGWTLLTIFYLGSVEYLMRSLTDSEEVSRLKDSELRDVVVHSHDSGPARAETAGGKQ